MKFINAILIGLTLSLGSFVALAHHSTNGIYNEDKEVELTGTVKSWRFINPHPTLSVEVQGASGPETWDMSYGGSAVAHLVRRGYAADTFKPGDRIKVRGFVSKGEGTHGMLVRGNPVREDGSAILPAPPAGARP
jgi:ribosomal protein L3